MTTTPAQAEQAVVDAIETLAHQGPEAIVRNGGPMLRWLEEQVAQLSRLRNEAMAELYGRGFTYGELSAAFGISRQRCQQMVKSATQD